MVWGNSLTNSVCTLCIVYDLLYTVVANLIKFDNHAVLIMGKIIVGNLRIGNENYAINFWKGKKINSK